MFDLILSIAEATSLKGIANPILSALLNFDEFIPTKKPSSVTKGPPLFPGLIAASVCTKCLPFICCSGFETIPSVIVNGIPKG